jgi:hypothetical protein
MTLSPYVSVVFRRGVCLGGSLSFVNIIYTICIFEDKIANADLGIKVGLNSILMGHDHNSSYDGEAIRVNKWKDIFNIIVGE